MMTYKIETQPSGKRSITYFVNGKIDSIEYYDETVIIRQGYKNIDTNVTETWRLKSILIQDGLLNQVETALNNLPEPNKTMALLAWEYSPTVNSASNTTKFVQNVLKLTDEQLEEIFINANNIEI